MTNILQIEASPGEEPPPNTAVLDDALKAYLHDANQQVVAHREKAPADWSKLSSAAFAKLYLGHFCRQDFCRMHLASLKRYDDLATADVLNRRGTRFALAAPRGCAKSSIHTLVIPLLDILLKRERYIVIISATYKQAKQRLSNIQGELLNNPKLRELFPDVCRKGKPWSKTAFVANGVRVEAYGAGAEVRGISFGEVRPTKIILDDAEDSRSAFRSARREELLVWYDEVIENLGDTYTHIEAVGTVLHRESLLSRLMGRVGYNSSFYQSIESFATRSDLWVTWMKMYTDLRSDTREEDSRRFYKENEAEMLRGTQVLWPAKEDYLYLMEQMMTRGRAAFYKEKQNQPLVGEGHILEPSRWNFFEVGMEDHCLHSVRNPYTREFKSPGAEPPALENAGATGRGTDPTDGNTTSVEFEIRPGLHVKRDLQIFGFLDPAFGRHTGKGDYSAIATVGRDRDGYYYVLDLWMRRATPTEQVEQIYALHEQYGYTKFGYEANGYQELMNQQMEDQRKRRKPQGRPWQLPLQPVTHSLKKTLRIAAMEPALTASWVYFCTSMPPEFITQAEEFPDCRHDDGLDALAACLALAKDFEPKKSGMMSFKVKPPRGPAGF